MVIPQNKTQYQEYIRSFNRVKRFSADTSNNSNWENLSETHSRQIFKRAIKTSSMRQY